MKPPSPHTTRTRLHQNHTTPDQASSKTSSAAQVSTKTPQQNIKPPPTPHTTRSSLHQNVTPPPQTSTNNSHHQHKPPPTPDTIRSSIYPLTPSDQASTRLNHLIKHTPAYKTSSRLHLPPPPNQASATTHHQMKPPPTHTTR